MHLYQHGMDLTLISQWLGHASLETTLVYYGKLVIRSMLMPIQKQREKQSRKQWGWKLF